MAATITDLLSLRQHSPTDFESINLPEKMGNTANWAFGGNTLGIAIAAALQTVPPTFYLYTAMGNYLGPASIDCILHCSVRSLRSTKTFCTRLVEVSQMRDDGQKRLCMFMTADFHAPEPDTVLTYSCPPRRPVSAVQDCLSEDEHEKVLLERGVITAQDVKIQRQLFGLAQRFFDRRPCPEGIMAQTYAGAAPKGMPTTQDQFPIYEKTSSDYFRAKHRLETPAQHVAALAFVMDMATSFVPLVHSGSTLMEAGVQSSLDFAMRVFVNGGEGGLDLNEWNLREWATVTGGEGRTYTELRVWDLKGRMLGNMTQQCILRPKKEVIGRPKI